MKTGTIRCGDANLEFSKIIMGTADMGSKIPRDDSFALLDLYYERGGRTIDTARIYASYNKNGDSKSEYTVGDWIRSRGVEQEVSVITKGAHPELQTMTTHRLYPESIRYDINTSLAVLRMDQVAMFFLHRDNPDIPVGEIMDVMHELVEDGLVGSIGASNWSAQRILEANEYAVRNQKTPFCASQIQWSLAYCDPKDLADPTCVCMDANEYLLYLANGIPVMAYSAQAGGFFFKYLAGQELSPVSRTFLNETNERRAKRVEVMSGELNCSIAALSLAYIINNRLDGYAVISASSPAQLEDSLSAADVTLREAEIDWLLK